MKPIEKHSVLTSLLLIGLLITLSSACQRDEICDRDSLSSCKSTIGITPIGIDTSNVSDPTYNEIAFPLMKKTEVSPCEGLILQKAGIFYIFQGDVVLDQGHVNNLIASLSHNQKSATTSSFIKYWPNHTVYYTYASGFTGQTEVQQAITEWQTKTGLDFVYGTGSGNYIEFQNNNNMGNISYGIGMMGGKQIITLQNGYYVTGTVIHEIGHAVGLIHEHCRSDRDNYLIIYPENIQYTELAQFAKCNISENSLFGPLDISSIMMYGSDYFSKNGLSTIKTINGSDIQAQRTHLSTLDAEGMKAIYGPPYHKLISIVEESDYQSSGDYEQWSSLTSNTIYFYSDKACTIPASLQYDRRMEITHMTVIVDHGNHEYHPYTYNVTIPAGSSQYFVGAAQTSMYSEFGTEFGIEEYYKLAY